MIKKFFNHWIFFIYMVIMLLVSIYSFKKPEYNWDILPYMAVILLYDGNSNIEKIHKDVYTIAKQDAPETVFSKLDGSASAYRKSIFTDPAEFNLQLPFYVVKPLYTGVGYLFYKCGLSLPKATIIPSVISFFLISLLVFLWIREYYSQVFTFAFSTLLMLSPFMLEAVKLSTPDLVSAFLILGGLYSYIEKNNFNLTALFLLLSVFARLDNIIPVAFITIAIFFIENRKENLMPWKYILFTILVLASYFLVSWQAHSQGWSILYYPDFATHLNPYYYIHRPFSLTGYIRLFKSQINTGILLS